MGVGLHHVFKVADALSVIVLEPQAGIDVAGSRSGAQHGPGGAVQVIPGQFFPVIDLGQQLLSLFGGTGQDDAAVVGAHVLRVFLNGAVIPVGRLFRVLVDGIAQGSKQYITVIGEQNIVAAGDKADVGTAGTEGLAHGRVAGADGHVDLLHIIALFQELCLQQLLQRLGGRDDLVRVGVRGERDLQGGDLGDIVFRAAVIVGGFRLLACTAGGDTQAQCQCEDACDDFFHKDTSRFDFRLKAKKVCALQHIPKMTSSRC